MNTLELLHDKIVNTKNMPILLLGAGFSFGAKNNDGEPFMLGKDLTKALYDKVIVPNSKKVGLTDDEMSRVEKYVELADLKKICNIIRECKLLTERDSFLTKVMSGCSWPKSIDFEALTIYEWPYIFTLNIDNLVESIYKSVGKNINIWNVRSEFNENPSLTTVIKLHGDVNESEHNFVFDTEEYNQFIATGGRILDKFAEEYVKRDLIIVGTQFQEEDLDIVLKKLFGQGCNIENLDYFFISPGEFNRGLKNRIDENDNFYHIKMGNDQFFKYLREWKNEIIEDNQLLLANSFSDWGEEYKGSLTIPESHDLYYGRSPQVDDFINNVDIPRRYGVKKPGLILPAFNACIGKWNRFIVTIHGDAYVGKTTIAMRLLNNCQLKGYKAFYTKSTDLRNVQKARDYLDKQTASAKVAFCFENAALFYKNMVSLINVGSLKNVIIILTATESVHFTKKHSLSDADKLLDFYVSEKITYTVADDVYKKLSEKKSLGNFLKDTTKAGDIKRSILNKKDFIGMLYYANEGREFSVYFSDLYETLKAYSQFKMFRNLTFYSAIGCPYFSRVLLPDIAMHTNISEYNLYEFKKQFSDYIKLEDGYISLRFVRLFRKIVVNDITENEKVFMIKSLIELLAERIHDRDNTENYLLFQTILKVRHIVYYTRINSQKLILMFNQLEPKCKDLSYYWVQRCIINSNCNKYEDALISIRNAEKARGAKTYQIMHADAKNEMQWGLWCIDNQPSQINEHFIKGKGMMLELISNKERYKEAYAFSVHAYIDLQIKYYKKNNELPSDLDWETMKELMWNAITELKYKDSIFIKLTDRFIDFARSIHKESDVRGLRGVLTKKINRIVELEYNEIDEIPDITING